VTDSAGFCVWFTGLSGAGKTATAAALARRLERLGRIVTTLDGDEVRTLLSSDLGFSRADRDVNIARIAFVAREIVRHGGSVIVAAISPYEAARRRARESIGARAFVEVFVDTPLEMCEQRDVKGLYARARAGDVPGFTRVSDSYERPTSPDLVVRGIGSSPDQSADEMLATLAARGLLGPASPAVR